jgi:effector-binding domain-containing protein
MKKIFFGTFLVNIGIYSFLFHADGSNCIAGIHVHYSKAEVMASAHKDTVPVKIQLEGTSFNDMSILFISDTARQTQEIGSIFNKDYGELMKFIRENQLTLKKFLAFYYSAQSPWIVDIAVETDKLPSTLKGRIQSRIEKGGEVLIAHMWGPYSELSQAYSQIRNWLNKNNRMAKGYPFEVYINDPFTVKDPSEIQTDIYQPLQ